MSARARSAWWAWCPWQSVAVRCRCTIGIGDTLRQSATLRPCVIFGGTVHRCQAGGLHTAWISHNNSVGVSLVRSPDELLPALEAAWAVSPRALVERFVPAGREVRCGVLDFDGELRCLPLEEYRLDPDRPVRSGADKLGRTADGDLQLMAKDDAVAWSVDPGDPVTEVVWEVARRCHRALGCRDHSLWDVRVDPEGRPWVLEASLYCSFARQCVVVMMAAAADIALDELFSRSVDQAVQRRPG